MMTDDTFQYLTNANTKKYKQPTKDFIRYRGDYLFGPRCRFLTQDMQ